MSAKVGLVDTSVNGHGRCGPKYAQIGLFCIMPMLGFTGLKKNIWPSFQKYNSPEIQKVYIPLVPLSAKELE